MLKIPIPKESFDNNQFICDIGRRGQENSVECDGLGHCREDQALSLKPSWRVYEESKSMSNRRMQSKRLQACNHRCAKAFPRELIVVDAAFFAHHLLFGRAQQTICRLRDHGIALLSFDLRAVNGTVES
jgi:hypothetical protein